MYATPTGRVGVDNLSVNSQPGHPRRRIRLFGVAPGRSRRKVPMGGHFREGVKMSGSGRFGALAVSTALLSGCAASTAPVGPGTMFAPGRSEGLVLAPCGRSGSCTTAEARDSGAAWEEFRRNDDALGVGGSSGLTRLQLVDVRSVDWRRTTNGRVRESSRTRTRTFQIGRLRTR